MHQDHVTHSFLLSLLRESGPLSVAGETGAAAALREFFRVLTASCLQQLTVSVSKTKHPQRSTSDLKLLFEDLGASRVFCSHKSPTASVGRFLSLLWLAKSE